MGLICVYWVSAGTPLVRIMEVIRVAPDYVLRQGGVKISRRSKFHYLTPNFLDAVRWRENYINRQRFILQTTAGKLIARTQVFTLETVHLDELTEEKVWETHKKNKIRLAKLRAAGKGKLTLEEFPPGEKLFSLIVPSAAAAGL